MTGAREYFDTLTRDEQAEAIRRLAAQGFSDYAEAVREILSEQLAVRQCAYRHGSGERCRVLTVHKLCAQHRPPTTSPEPAPSTGLRPSAGLRE